MIPRENNFLLKLCQYTALAPIQFNHSKLTFESSKCLQIFTNTISISIFLIFFTSLFPWVKYITVYHFIGSIEILFMKISFLIYTFYGLIIIYEKLFQISQLVELMNRIFKLQNQNSIMCDNQKLNKSLFILISTFVMILPFILFCTNLLYLIETAVSFEMGCVCLLIVTSINWMSTMITPVYLGIEYVTHNLNIINQNLNLMLENKKCENNILDISRFHTNLVEIFNQIISYYRLHILLFILGIGGCFMWEFYAVFEILIIHMTVYYEQGYIALLFYAVNFSYTLIQLLSFIWLIYSMLKGSKKTITSLHDLQSVTFDMELRKDVD